ncbi:hypothetical protein F511_21905 [Dorcoceras hygrometricum]|uniref:Uncharacterized protein n=1 Tax=Dorcoceras hygrometricum TaxID=472368 RepID=A0A2Z7BKW1_9LAMI|nr:hypothetical protein F511_21905 [Dorcoceras hygrometricum]
MSSIKNPLAVILDSNKFTGLNYHDWLQNLKIVLASEKLLYMLEKCWRSGGSGSRSRGAAEDFKILHRGRSIHNINQQINIHRVFIFGTLLASRRLAPTNFTRKLALQRLAVVVLLIRSTTGITTPLSVCTRKYDESFTDGISSSRWSEQVQPRQAAAHGGRDARRAAREGRRHTAAATHDGRRPRGRKRRGGRRL